MATLSLGDITGLKTMVSVCVSDSRQSKCYIGVRFDVLVMDCLGILMAHIFFLDQSPFQCSNSRSSRCHHGKLSQCLDHLGILRCPDHIMARWFEERPPCLLPTYSCENIQHAVVKITQCCMFAIYLPVLYYG